MGGGLICLRKQNFAVGCQDGDVRLAGGPNYNEGRVEFCFNNEFGTVCDGMWDTTDASIVCRQLGLSDTGN